MTGTREPQQDGSIQAMLRDAGLEAATELRSSLEQLRALVPDQAPAARADLAALLAGGSRGSAAESLPEAVPSLSDRRGRKRRLAVVGGAVVGAMTLGAGAVAASSEDFRMGVSHTVGVLFQPSGGTPAPRPAGPSPAEIPAGPVPDPAGTGPAQQGTAGPGSATATTPASPAGTPPATGRNGVLPAPPNRPVTPAVPGVPGAGDGRSLPVKPHPAPTVPGLNPPNLPGPGGLPADE